MNKFNLIGAVALFAGFGITGAYAMPANSLSGLNVGAKPEQVRLVCNRWGRCWRRPDYAYSYGYAQPSYGYGYGYYGGGRRWR